MLPICLHQLPKLAQHGLSEPQVLQFAGWLISIPPQKLFYILETSQMKSE